MATELRIRLLSSNSDNGNATSTRRVCSLRSATVCFSSCEGVLLPPLPGIGHSSNS